MIIAFLAFGIYLVLHKEEKNTNKFDSVVTSSVILDINPSIKLELNKSSQVVNVVALNEDANQVVSDDLKEKELTYALKSITENLINMLSKTKNNREFIQVFPKNDIFKK